MAIPTKRFESNILSYLDLDEIKALLAEPDPSTWLGRRDHALLVLMIQTGVRVSELKACGSATCTRDRCPHPDNGPRAERSAPRP